MTTNSKIRAFGITFVLLALAFGIFFVDSPVVLAVAVTVMLVIGVGYEFFTTRAVSLSTRWLWGGIVISNIPLYSEVFGYPLGPEKTGFTVAGLALMYYWYFVIFRNQIKATT